MDRHLLDLVCHNCKPKIEIHLLHRRVNELETKLNEDLTQFDPPPFFQPHIKGSTTPIFQTHMEPRNCTACKDHIQLDPPGEARKRRFGKCHECSAVM